MNSWLLRVLFLPFGFSIWKTAQKCSRHCYLSTAERKCAGRGLFQEAPQDPAWLHSHYYHSQNARLGSDFGISRRSPLTHLRKWRLRGLESDRIAQPLTVWPGWFWTAGVFFCSHHHWRIRSAVCPPQLLDDCSGFMRTRMSDRVFNPHPEDLLLFKISLNIRLLRMEEDSIFISQLPCVPVRRRRIWLHEGHPAVPGRAEDRPGSFAGRGDAQEDPSQFWGLLW